MELKKVQRIVYVDNAGYEAEVDSVDQAASSMVDDIVRELVTNNYNVNVFTLDALIEQLTKARELCRNLHLQQQ